MALATEYLYLETSRPNPPETVQPRNCSPRYNC